MKLRAFFARGFLLIELLIALALVVILCFLAFPIFRKAKEQANAARCVHNLHSCIQAILLHAGENQGRLVLPYASAQARDFEDFPFLKDHPQKGRTWAEHLGQLGYLGNRSVTVCPSFKPYRFTEESWGMSYGMRRTASSTRYNAIHLSAIVAPGHYLLLADSSRPAHREPYQWYYVTYPGNMIDTIHLRHTQKANVAFLDGSIRALSEQEILNLGDGWNSKAFDATPLP